jgi:hypothetical protein
MRITYWVATSRHRSSESKPFNPQYWLHGQFRYVFHDVNEHGYVKSIEKNC